MQRYKCNTIEKMGFELTTDDYESGAQPTVPQRPSMA